MNLSRLIRTAAALLVCAAPLCAQREPDPRPPLIYAIDHRDLGLAQAALRQGIDVNEIYDRDTMLGWALRGKNQEITRLLLQSPNIDVNKRGFTYDAFGDWERPPLTLAAHMGNAEMVSLLLQKGARVNAKDATDRVPEARGDTALLRAAQRDQTNVIQVLLTQAKGIDVNAVNKDGQSSLWFVTEAEDFESVRLLHQHGARINITDKAGKSLLVNTITHKSHQVLDYLVANGADINTADSTGLTPMMEAALMLHGKNAPAALEFLNHAFTFKPKVDLQVMRAQGNGGFTVLQLAARSGSTEAVALLLDHGAAIDLKSQATGGTALHEAVLGKQLETVRLLLDRGANPNLTTSYGATPLKLANDIHNQKIVALLSGYSSAKPQSSAPPAATAEAPAARTPVPLDALLGTWTGTQDGLPQAVFTLKLNRDNTYGFKSELSAAAQKALPKGAAGNKLLAAHFGTFTLSGDALTLNTNLGETTVLHLRLNQGQLTIDNRTHMRKAAAK